MSKTVGGRVRGSVAALTCMTAVVAGSVPAGADEARHSRLYLLAGPGAGQMIWSTTPADREAAEPVKTARCEVSTEHFSTWPCRTLWSTSKTTYQAFGFTAGSLLDAPITWNADEVSFHLEMTIEAPAAPEVAVFLGGDDTPNPATEVSPGVWEGRVRTAGSLDSLSNKGIYVGVRSAAGVLGMTMKMAGASWFEFPSRFAGMSGPEVIAADTYRPAPSVFASAERTFRFNDDDWEVRPFTGTHDAVRTVPLPLQRPAAAVYVYVEGFSEPAGYALTHNDGRGLSLTEQPVAQVTEVGATEPLTSGARGAALNEVQAGDYVVTVNPPGIWSFLTGSPPIPMEYKGYVVIAYGKRTLSGMHFPFPPSSVAAFRTPIARNFPPVSEHVPVPVEATSLVPVLTAERMSLVDDTWAMPYGGHTTSGSAWTGQRILVRDGDVMLFGVTPMEEDQVSAQDVKFWLDVAYTYSPAAAPGS